MSENTLKHRRKVVFDYILPLFKEQKPEFSRYWDQDHETPIDLATWDGWPDEKNNITSTLGMSFYDEYKYGELYTKSKVEFLGVCNKKYMEVYRQIMATCVFCVIKGKWFSCPNAIFPDVIKTNNASITMSHIFFDAPFLWPESLSCVILDEVRTGWLMTIPISDAEYQYAIDHSVEALGGLLEKHEIDYMDLNRKSVL